MHLDLLIAKLTGLLMNKMFKVKPLVMVKPERSRTSTSRSRATRRRRASPKDLAKMETRSPVERDVVPAKAARGTHLDFRPVPHRALIFVRTTPRILPKKKSPLLLRSRYPSWRLQPFFLH